MPAIITIQRTPEQDEVCRQTCKAYTAPDAHSLFCPYTRERWKHTSALKQDQVIVMPVKDLVSN